MISKEEYAALREQIIAELKEEKRAKNRYNKPTSFAVYTLAE